MIPTAHELLFSDDTDKLKIQDIMIEFAKLHVQEALKQASEKAITEQGEYYYEFEINKDSIINAYPLENIK